MRVFVLGGPGLIGVAVIRDLIKHCHKVLALSRSTRSVAILKALGTSPLRGDLRAPDAWVQSVRRVDAVIQVAATFTEDMGQVESKALEAIIQALGRKDGKIHLIYTGGVWLYGATGNSIANETTQFQPMPALAWVVETSEKITAHPSVCNCCDTPRDGLSSGGRGLQPVYRLCKAAQTDRFGKMEQRAGRLSTATIWQWRTVFCLSNPS